MTNEQREAIETMQHWIEYEKEHKNEINKADELIYIQDTVLSLIKENSAEIQQKNTELAEKSAELDKKDKQIDLMAVCILSREIGKNTCQFNKSCTKYEKGRDIHCKDCIKQYFERKVEDVES